MLYNNNLFHLFWSHFHVLYPWNELMYLHIYIYINIIQSYTIFTYLQYVIMALCVTDVSENVRCQGLCISVWMKQSMEIDSLADWIIFKQVLYALFHFASLSIAFLNEFHSAHFPPRVCYTSCQFST